MVNNESDPKRPNIILILVDDMGFSDIGCYGSEIETPNLDKLADKGISFTSAYNCARCCPTRASLLTGLYPHQAGVGHMVSNHGIPAYQGYLRDDCVTIAEALSLGGYQTLISGKWHVGGIYPRNDASQWDTGDPQRPLPPDRGFDDWYGTPAGAGSYYNPKPLFRNYTLIEPESDKYYYTDAVSENAVKMVEKAAMDDKPFFLYMAHYAVHTPIEAKAERIAKYKARKSAGQNNPTYAAMIESMDDAVGQIMSTLDELNLSDNTVVIFTSDNGGLSRVTNNAPLRAGKGYPYEGGIRVPVIIRWPGVIRAGTVSDESVTSVDYFPTICELADVRLPHGRTIDGVSLAEYLKSNGAKKPGRESVFWHFPHYRDYGFKIVPYSIILSLIHI